jgi:hypothetical protein
MENGEMYIALLKQKAPGCDYSIACGMKWVFLRADNEQDALAELHRIVIGFWDEEDGWYDDGLCWDDHKLGKVILLDVARRIDIPVAEWYDAAKQREEQARLFDQTRRFEQFKAKLMAGDEAAIEAAARFAAGLESSIVDTGGEECFYERGGDLNQ